MTMRSILILVCASFLSVALVACGAATPSGAAPTADTKICKPPTGTPPETCESDCHYDPATTTCLPVRGIIVTDKTGSPPTP
jgi:hypothetical protein